MKDLKTISFSVFINSDREKVWEVLWQPQNYEKWTTAFAEGSRYEGELKQGNTIKFLANDGGGMTSQIEKLVENEQMVFIHQNEIRDGEETQASWIGAREIYHLKKETNNATELQVVIDVSPDMEGYINDAFPKALALVKQLAEI